MGGKDYIFWEIFIISVRYLILFTISSGRYLSVEFGLLEILLIRDLEISRGGIVRLKSRLPFKSRIQIYLLLDGGWTT